MVRDDLGLRKFTFYYNKYIFKPISEIVLSPTHTSWEYCYRVYAEPWISSFSESQTLTLSPYVCTQRIRAQRFPGGASGKKSSCHCKRHTRYRFDLWVGKIP